MTLVGAAVTPATGQTWPEAIDDFETLTGRAMPVRRCYDKAPPSDVSGSQVRFDLGQRASLYSIKPSLSTPVATLESLAASLAGHPVDVIVFHEPVDDMSGDAFKALYAYASAPFRDAGVPVGVCFTNWSCNLPYSDSKSALAHYWPGDDAVDFVAIDEYPVGEITSTKDATPMDARTRRVCQFADRRGIQLGVAEYGVDAGVDVTKADTWLRSVTDWADARAGAGKPLRWACYFSSGSNTLTHPEHVDAYIDSYRILEV